MHFSHADYNATAMKALVTIILASAALPSLSQTIVNPVRTLTGAAMQGSDLVEFRLVDSQVINGYQSRTIEPGRVMIESEFRPVSTTVGDWLFETTSTLTIFRQGTTQSQIMTRFSGSLELSAPTLVSLNFTATTSGGGVAAFILGSFSSTTSASFQEILGPGSYAFELSGEIPLGWYPDAGVHQGVGRVHMTTQAVPEPSTLAVLGLSSAILAVRRRRRARL